MVVVAKGRPKCSTTFCRCVGLVSRMADEPMTATGRRAAAINSAARAIASLEAVGNLPGAASTGTGSFVDASATSSGRSRCTGPRGSLIAIRIASATVAPISPLRSGSVALVIGLNNAWWSIHI